MIAIVTSIPGVSTIPVFATVTPLVFVLGITAIKDAYEDYKRYRNDSEVNARTAVVLRPDGGEDHVMWKDLQVGHLVRVRRDNKIPADIVMLSSANESGECRIQTANLDGETNLKMRQAIQATSGLGAAELRRPGRVTILCERPNVELYGFEGKIRLSGDSKDYSLGPSQVLLRGSILKETKDVLGVVVYTGDQTKVMLNNDPPRFKRSHMDIEMNRQMYLIFLLQFLIVFSATVLSSWFYRHRGTDHWYLGIDDTSTGATTRISIRNFFAFYVLLSVMVPISLYVSMELVRLGQAYLINVDNRMYEPENGKLAVARATTLSEELGQVQYVFSDKTGTLTSNQMTFQRCSINGQLYGDALLPLASKEALGASVAAQNTGRSLKISRGDNKTNGLTGTDSALLSTSGAPPQRRDQDIFDRIKVAGDPKFCNMKDASLVAALLDGSQVRTASPHKAMKPLPYARSRVRAQRLRVRFFYFAELFFLLYFFARRGGVRQAPAAQSPRR